MSSASGPVPGAGSSPVSPEQFAVWADFVLAHTHVMRAVETDLRRECGLSFTQYDVLYNLHAAPDGLTVSQVGTALLYSSGSVTNLLNRMEQLGLVHRTRAVHDRRVSRTTTSPDGEVLFARATDVVLAAVAREFTRFLHDSEVAPVAAFLARVRAQDQALRQPPYDRPGSG